MKHITLYLLAIVSFFSAACTLANSAVNLVYSGTSISHLKTIAAYDITGNSIGGPDTAIERGCYDYFFKKYGAKTLILTTQYHINLSNFIMSATSTLDGVKLHSLFPLGTTQDINHYFQFMSDDRSTNIYFSIRPHDADAKAEVGGHTLLHSQLILCTITT